MQKEKPRSVREIKDYSSNSKRTIGSLRVFIENEPREGAMGREKDKNTREKITKDFPPSNKTE